MRVDGAGKITVEAYGISSEIHALVSDAIQDEMLLSYTQNNTRGISKYYYRIMP